MSRQELRNVVLCNMKGWGVNYKFKIYIPVPFGLNLFDRSGSGKVKPAPRHYGTLHTDIAPSIVQLTINNTDSLYTD